MNTMISFIITGIAGLSTLLGIIPIYFKKFKEENILPNSFLFASGVMLTISLSSLLPEAIVYFLRTYNCFLSFFFTFLFIMMGIVFSFFITKKIDKRIDSNTLYRLGIVSVIAIIFHNIPEGIMTFLSSNSDLKLGILLSIGICFHNIPEGISVALPIYYATKNKKIAFFYTFISGFSELLGAILAYFFLAPFITSFLLGVVLAIACGIMIYLSIFELIPTACSYPLTLSSIFFFFFGILLMIGCFLLLQ